MRRIWTVAVAVLLTATACTNFLDAPKAVADPNNPTVASRNQLFVGVQANTFGYYEGYVPMLVCMWMQQCAGINSRFVQTEGEYGITAGSLDEHVMHEERYSIPESTIATFTGRTG